MFKSALVAASLLATLAVSNTASAAHEPAVGLTVNAGGVLVDVHTGLPVRPQPVLRAPPPRRIWIAGHFERYGRREIWVDGHYQMVR